MQCKKDKIESNPICPPLYLYRFSFDTDVVRVFFLRFPKKRCFLKKRCYYLTSLDNFDNMKLKLLMSMG